MIGSIGNPKKSYIDDVITDYRITLKILAYWRRLALFWSPLSATSYYWSEILLATDTVNPNVS